MYGHEILARACASAYREASAANDELGLVSELRFVLMLPLGRVFAEFSNLPLLKGLDMRLEN